MAAADGGRADTQVAVLGTGIMGSAMAGSLIAAGLRTAVWDRSPSATSPLAAAGALAASSPQEAVRDAHVVITMLPTAAVVDSVMFAGGVAEALPESSAWAQMGTIGVQQTIDIAGRLGKLRPDVRFVDAPGIRQEALELAGRLDTGSLAEAIEGGPLDAPIADAKLHKMDRGDFAPEFPLEWALKDVDLALASADGDPLPLLAALSRQWHAAVDAGHGREDVSAARLALGSQ